MADKAMVSVRWYHTIAITYEEKLLKQKPLKFETIGNCKSDGKR